MHVRVLLCDLCEGIYFGGSAIWQLIHKFHPTDEINKLLLSRCCAYRTAVTITYVRLAIEKQTIETL